MDIVSKLIYTVSFILLLASTTFSQLPYLQKNNGTVKLIVDDKPFIMLAGELHNSTGSSIEYMDGLWSKMADLNLNTVLPTASWELIEPEEGKFDFSLVDAIIEGARRENIKIVLVWFGSWKNGESTYAPRWVKKDPKRFLRAKDANGKTLEILSPFSEENLKADRKAYTTLLEHIKAVDYDHTVIMVQCENEVGVFRTARDHSSLAEKKWTSDVPADLIQYLQNNKENLHGELKKVWVENGEKTRGNWDEVFGKSREKGDYPFYTEQLFMSYYYAKYINEIAEAGKKVLNLPVFCNAWLRYATKQLPGSFPSGGPNAEAFDTWKAAGKSIDFLAPDIYVDQFDSVCNVYTRKDNPLFIPESGFGAVRAMYAVGEYDALGFSPFGIDGDAVEHSSETEVKQSIDAYQQMANMDSLITSNYGSDKMRGVYLNQYNPIQTLVMGNYEFKLFPTAFRPQFDFVDDPPSQLPKKPFNAGGLIIQISENEFYILGCGFKFEVKTKEGVKSEFAGVLSIDEGAFNDNRFIPGRRRNGDSMTGLYPLMEKEKVKSFKVELYHF
ncbi:DUF5597 domain-containing protein [Gaoshiqia sediminis]|uniref:DUF5597 domain-containing protein n=1 Tax=Gaoshiqia sediminis TaxID=2986998 RepID=A0AA41Y9B9_9BACT|nr:DUF5597 domain-containing protein [Gaoshiqia sediminis]MCW0483971.1 DUF5597 domain-containing protein [Gaoshiqia sediminis]